MKKAITVFLILIIGCSASKESEEYHPKEELFPYHSSTVNVYSIERKFNEKIKESKIVRGQSLLEKEAFRTTFQYSLVDSIPEPLASLEEIEIESSEAGRVFVLDVFQNEVFEYSLEEQEWQKIAGQGRGPGEIMFSKDLVYDNNKLYVTASDTKISVFDCTFTPCEFEKVINTSEIFAYSSIIKDDTSIIMGQYSKNSQMSSNIDEIQTLFKMDKNGNISEPFGSFYDIRNQWMLIQPFQSGKVRAVNDQNDSFIQYYDLIPELYYFEKNKLKKKYQINGFNISKRKYIPETQELFINFEDWSFIDDMSYVNDNLQILVIKHLGNPRDTKSGFEWDESKDFYLLDTKANKSTFLGQTFLNVEDLWFTSHNIIQKVNNKFFIYNYSIDNDM
ncbi:MAG TPA: hypothetical protein DEQ34_11960 [Balneolaceae bacterium]|nr:hypothetical protein [Balneolaceae bacterium]|tara:strand:+ start:938 stop:2110 length:1173 start_codon:yes stop_codon:yes gene_type:complete